jgi:6,7-dimethyl-8-ribityllumazine synthase
MADHILIVEARFYEELADDLVRGAIAALQEAGATFDRLDVPGVFEVPAAVHMAASLAGDAPAGVYDGFIALGCVIRGETDHYDHICREASRALMDVTNAGIPVGFGILTCGTYEQAKERADVGRKNKGAEAARACLRMIAVRRALNQGLR